MENFIETKIKPNILITPNGCWEWQLYIGKAGYGMVGYKGKTEYTHRLVCSITYGPIPKGFVVRHICNNKICCNPEHLSIGTRSDNANDYIRASPNRNLTRQRAYKPRGLDGEPLIQWAKKNIVNVSADGCWIVDKNPNQLYSSISVAGRQYLTHRYLFCIKSGLDYNADFVACHTCDQTACVNPDHITAGTQKDNSRDARKYAKHVILTEEIVIEIAKSFVETPFEAFGSQDRWEGEQAAKYGVCKGAIHSIARGYTWADITKDIISQKIEGWRPRLPNTVLNPDKVKSIKDDMKNWNFKIVGSKGSFDQKWAEIFNVGRSAIRSVRDGKRWGNVTS